LQPYKSFSGPGRWPRPADAASLRRAYRSDERPWVRVLSDGGGREARASRNYDRYTQAVRCPELSSQVPVIAISLYQHAAHGLNPLSVRQWQSGKHCRRFGKVLLSRPTIGAGFLSLSRVRFRSRIRPICCAFCCASGRRMRFFPESQLGYSHPAGPSCH
jgi:hypothetical protein